jgi:3-dehydroquinate dehydratase
MIHEQIRTARNTIAFIEKIYRKRDPKYADFSIQQQEEILRRLNREETRSECSFVASVHTNNQAEADSLLETNFSVTP